MPKEKSEETRVREAIRKTPTASDAQIASSVGVDRDVVQRVRAELGSKSNWRKEEE